MFSSLRKRLTFANVAMVLVLVFAMSGGAYAAKKYLITSTKQISPSVLKALAGKPGHAGPAGSAGPVGAQGPAGTPGAKGETGAAGKDGAAGKEGPTGPKGTTGATGPKGATGEPWPAGGTLPPGATETGTFAFEPGGGNLNVNVLISFPIPLAAPLGGAEVHLIGASGQEIVLDEETFAIEEVKPTKCGSALSPAGTVANPAAAAGNLCVYITKTNPASAETEAMASNLIVSPATTCEVGECTPALGGPGAGTSVAGVRMSFGDSFKEIYGTWAVSGPKP